MEFEILKESLIFAFTMKIRMAKIKDAAAITAQNISLAEESENIHLKQEIVVAGVKALISDQTKGFYIVAEEKNAIIGQLMITVEWSDWRNKPIWWIQSVYVKKEWRKKGIFTQMLSFIKQKSQKQKVAFLRLYTHKNNKSASYVYEKIGWTQEPYLFYHLSI